MEPELKLYTIVDLRSWLINNNPPVGLNEHVIAPVRAYAILNNPYVKDDDAVVATIYEGEELAAFTAAFPEITNHQLPITNYKSNRIWWASTLWCNQKFQGKGYGLIVIGSLMEAHEGEVTLDRWGAQETVEIFKCLGYETIYTPRYHLGDKTINRSTLKGKLAYTMQECIKCLHRCIYKSPITNHKYLLKYSTFIDGEAYAFIQAHRRNDLFLREQKMLNWILRYPFTVGCNLKGKVELENVFSSYVSRIEYKVVKVYNQPSELIGVYLWHMGAISYLYYDELQKDIVFQSIVEHIRRTNVGLVTENPSLAKFIKHNLYFPKMFEEQISYSYPIKESSTLYPLHSIHTFQLGDGDSFA